MAKKRGKFDDGIRWYHILFAWMIILPWFLIAIIPEGAWAWWMILIFLGAIGLGVALIGIFPLKENNKTEEG